MLATAGAGGDALVTTFAGRSTWLSDERHAFSQPRIAPDETAVAATLHDRGQRPALALFSADDGRRLRTWSEAAVQPRWSVDGRWILFAAASPDAWHLRWVSATEPSEGQSAGELLTQVSSAPRPGYTVLQSAGAPGQWVLPEDEAAGSCPDLVQISPDGRLSASVITPAAAASRVIVVARSTSVPTALDAGSFEPVWSADGQWLFHRDDTGLVRRRVRSAEPLAFDAPERLAGIMPVAGVCGVPNYDVSRDGSRVISVQRPAIESPSRVRFIQHYRPSAAPAPGHLVTLPR